MATGTSLVEVDVPERPPTRADEPGGAARPKGPMRRWHAVARCVLAGLLVLGVVVGSPFKPPETADAAPAQEDYSNCIDNDPTTDCEQAANPATNCTGASPDIVCEVPEGYEDAEHDEDDESDPCRDVNPQTPCGTAENPATNCTGEGEDEECEVPEGYESDPCRDADPETPCGSAENPALDCTGTGLYPECSVPEGYEDAEHEVDESDPCRDQDPETPCERADDPAANCTGEGTWEHCEVPEELQDDANPDQDEDEDEDEEVEVGPVPDSDHVMGEGSCDGVDEVAATGRSGGKFQSYEVYGDEWLALGTGSSAQELAEADDVCVPEGYVLISCRDEKDNWRDDHGVVQVEADLPRWWFQEIETESTTNEGNGCSLAEHPPDKPCDQLVDVVTVNVTANYSYTYRDTEDYDDPGIVPDKCWGTYPTALYEISANDDNDFDVLGMLTALMFGIAKGAIQAVLWLVEFGFDFNITQYTHAAEEIAEKYQLHLIEPLNLLDVVWFWLLAWVAITALRGKFAMAGGELLMTLMLLTLATVLYENNSSYMRSTANFMDLSSSALLSAAQGQDPVNHDNLLSILIPLEADIHEQFIEMPYHHLNWGGDIARNADCLEAAEHVMATGHSSDGWPSRHMRRAGQDDECDAYADYNKDANGSRTFGALLTLVVAVLVALTLGITAFTVLVCKFLVALLFAVTPFVVLSAVLPATGRRLFWSWLGSVFQLVLAVIGSGGLLALEFIGVDTVTSVAASQDLIDRWFLVLMVVATVFFARRKMIGQTQKLATSLSDSLTRLSPGSAHWSGGGQVGFDLDRVDRGAMQSLRTAGYGAAIGAYAGGYVAWTGMRGGAKWGLDLGRDKRNRRFAARNLAYNRQMLHQEAQRPRTTYRRQPDGSFKEAGTTIELPDAVTPHETRRHQQILGAAEGRDRQPRVEVIDHGKNPKTTRLLNTYRPRPGKGPQTPKTPRKPKTPPKPRTPPNLRKLIGTSRNKLGRFKMRIGGFK